jgi:ketosteroid isomerase-like protein
MEAEFGNRIMEQVRASGAHDALASLFDAAIRGDFEAFADALHDDVELDIRGTGPMDGKWTGRLAVTDAVRANFAQLATQQPEIECILKEGDSAAVLFRESGTFVHDGRAYRSRVVQWFTFDGDKIKKIDEIAAVAAA